ncbi:MAG: hypothetical protein ABIQ35_14260 [Verrucomicrobiota bacterium]
MTPAPDHLKLLPAYPLAAAARLIGAQPSTFHAWFRGKSYSTEGKTERTIPILSTSSRPGAPISFIDLVEAHVFFLIRKKYNIPIRNIRAAAEELSKIKGSLIYLAHKDIYLNAKHVFLKINDRLVSLSERGQTVDRDIIASGLGQLNYGSDGYASEFYPKLGDEEQKEFVVTPERNFGRICIARLSVGADVIHQRFFRGEKITDIAADYAATKDEVEGAIRWHDRLAA